MGPKASEAVSNPSGLRRTVENGRREDLISRRSEKKLRIGWLIGLIADAIRRPSSGFSVR
jgi:hypothetical protein